MAKIKVICEICDHIQSVTLPPVRRKKRISVSSMLRNSRLDYSLEVDADILESRDFTRADDSFLYAVGIGGCGIIGIGVHFVLNNLVGGQAPPTMALYMAGLGGVAGFLFTHWALCDEVKIDRRKANWLKNILSRGVLVDRDKPCPVVLEVDHRARDGHGELGRTINYFGALPVEVGKFNDYIRAVDRGETLAINHWTGKGKPFDRTEYERLLEMLRESGIVSNLGGNRGHQLTQAGKRAIKNHLRQAPSPTPVRDIQNV